MKNLLLGTILAFVILLSACSNSPSSSSNHTHFKDKNSANAQKGRKQTEGIDKGNVNPFISASIPTEDKMKRDIVGKVFIDPDRPQYHSSFHVTSIDQVQEISVEDEELAGDRVLYYVRVILYDGTNHYNVKANLTYIRNTKGFWELDFVESKEFNLILTGRYDGCIHYSRTQGWTGALNAENACDIALIISGRYFSYGSWTQFQIYVDGQSTSVISHNEKAELEIFSVERP